MNKRNLVQIAVAFALALPLICQTGPGASKDRIYDPMTEISFWGTVENVGQASAFGGFRSGTHIIVKSENETYEVHLGPTSFLQSKGFKLTTGDQVEVTGSKVRFPPIIIARQIRKGNTTMTLRDAQGVPMWSHAGKKPGMSSLSPQH